MIADRNPSALTSPTMNTENTPQNAITALAHATTEYLLANTAKQNAANAVKQAAINALNAGVTPGVVAHHSPYTAAYIREFARANGVPPAQQQRRTA